MCLCMFGQNPPIGSEDRVQTMSNTDADGIRTKSNKFGKDLLPAVSTMAILVTQGMTSGAKPKFVYAMIPFALFWVPEKTDYRNQTSKNNTVVFFSPIWTGKASTRTNSNKNDSLRAILFHDCCNGITTSYNVFVLSLATVQEVTLWTGF